jgi:hypothetical protein
MEIAIIGAGWYGCHLALQLTKAGHQVVLYEKNPQILSQISGAFGIRLHAGPHYPRSAETRKSCLRSLEEFKVLYPELVIPHEYSIYGLGISDAEGKPAKITKEEFVTVCSESASCTILDPQKAGYTNLITAAKINEPSIALGTRLRTAFTQYLNDARVTVRCNFDVQEINYSPSGASVFGAHSEQHFTKVINTTSYQAFLPPPKDFPFDMETVYQPCLALQYEDNAPGPRPFSFIVMDGWFPCIMPVCDGGKKQKYILTHSKWTIMGSYDHPAKAYTVLNQLSDAWIERNVRPFCEQEIGRFWPAFAERFTYVGWKGTVLAKLKTRKEFRSAVTYEKDNIIHVVPGKISNVLDVEREVKSLIIKKNVLENKGYCYIQGGVLQQSCDEIVEKPVAGESNTCTLHTFEELQKAHVLNTEQSTKATRPTPQKKHNSSFILSCLMELAAKAALVALACLSLAARQLNAAFKICTIGSLSFCYSMHSFFTENKNKHTEQEQTCPTSVVLANEPIL